MKLFLFLLIALSSASQLVYAQTKEIDKVAFFEDTSILKANIITQTGKLMGSTKQKGFILRGTFNTILADGSSINDPVLLQVRGNFRRNQCYIPPLKVIFPSGDSSRLSPLKSLKLVNECSSSNTNKQYLLKEYLIYKMYNLLTDMSFRVRLLNVNFQDSAGNKKTINEHAFFIEDAKDMARRNKCKEWKKDQLGQESTDRRQMTMVAIFEYMIGNTDWGVSADHNTVLIQSKADTLSRPFVVPYDFDFSGLVYTNYAIPDEKLAIEDVRQRVYRGFPRTMDEINEVLEIFKQHKEKIYDLIRGFGLLDAQIKSQMIRYLDGFFDMIKTPAAVRATFISNARTN